MEWFVVEIVINSLLWIKTLELHWISDLYHRVLELCMLALAVLQVLQDKTKS